MGLSSSVAAFHVPWLELSVRPHSSHCSPVAGRPRLLSVIEPDRTPGLIPPTSGSGGQLALLKQACL